jgi:hypothetical protein
MVTGYLSLWLGISDVGGTLVASLKIRFSTSALPQLAVLLTDKRNLPLDHLFIYLFLSLFLFSFLSIILTSEYSCATPRQPIYPLK